MALPSIDTEKDFSSLKTLRSTLEGHGYNEKAIAGLLDLWDISELSGADYALYCWKCRRANTPLSHLVSTFLLGLPSSKPRLRKLLGRDALECLLDIGLITHDGPIYSSEAVIYPCLGMMIFTDHWALAGGVQEMGKVYELGSDSYVLARVTPRKGRGKALDLCTGSGVHAVHSAVKGLLSSAVDINPRALMYTGFNSFLNEVDCSATLADLYSQTGAETYDLITANPPFVPSPDKEVLIHRSAGETGEEVPERLVAALPQKLNRGGLFSMVLEHPVFQDDPYLDRLERWLGETQGWAILVLTFKEYPAAKYVVRHLGGVEDQEAGYNSYLESYAAHGIVAMRFANVFIQRLPYNAKNFKLNLNTPWPNRDISDELDDWFEAISFYHNPDWEPEADWCPKPNSIFKNCWKNGPGTQGILETDDQTWIEAAPLGLLETTLFFWLNGKTPISRLRDMWVEAGHQESLFVPTLRKLALNRALEFRLRQ